jgi:hypothetical protein
MKVKATLFSLLLLSASWVVAQSTGPGGTSPSSSAPAQRQRSPTGANSQTASPNPTTQPSAPANPQSSPDINAPVTNSVPPNQAPGSQTTPGTSSTAGTSGASAAANGNGLTGCLSGSPMTGDYTLTDKSGNKYKLTGNLESIRTLIGNEVQVTGQEGSGANQTGTVSASSTGGQATASASAPGGSPDGTPGMNSSPATAGAMKQFNVSSATKVADQCNTPSTTTPGPTARWRKSEVGVASLQTGGTTPGTTPPASNPTTPSPGTTNPNTTPPTTPPTTPQNTTRGRRFFREP